MHWFQWTRLLRLTGFFYLKQSGGWPEWPATLRTLTGSTTGRIGPRWRYWLTRKLTERDICWCGCQSRNARTRPGTPLARDRPATLQNGPPSERRSRFGDLRRVLVAEGDSDTRLRLLYLLREWGFSVVVATDGIEALGVVELQQPPDFFFINRSLAGMNGMGGPAGGSATVSSSIPPTSS